MNRRTKVVVHMRGAVPAAPRKEYAMLESIALQSLMPAALYYVSPLLLLAGLVGLVICITLWLTRP